MHQASANIYLLKKCLKVTIYQVFEISVLCHTGGVQSLLLVGGVPSLYLGKLGA